MKNIPNRKYSTKNENDDYEFLKREILDKFVGNPKIFNETVINLDDWSGEYMDTYFFLK